MNRAFYETEEQKANFNSRMGLEGQIVELKTEIKDLKENIQVLIDNSTINMKQQKALYNLAKSRICALLGENKRENISCIANYTFKIFGAILKEDLIALEVITI